MVILGVPVRACFGRPCSLTAIDSNGQQILHVHVAKWRSLDSDTEKLMCSIVSFDHRVPEAMAAFTKSQKIHSQHAVRTDEPLNC